MAARIALGSIVVGLIVLALKIAAYRMTGSVALFSDAAESVVNVAAALAAFLAIRLAAKPADANHPYGHHKVEYFSAVLEGVLIVVAALAIVYEALGALRTTRVLDVPLEGLAVSALASLLNGVWAFVLIRAARRHRSPALAADGRHLLTDVVSSVGVIGGLLIARATGLAILDPAIALLVAATILWSGWVLLRPSIGGLMDEAAAPEALDTIRAVIKENAEGAIEAHDLRTRQAGSAIFIDFHLVVPGAMSVSQAHEICDRIEQALRRRLDELIISIHVEPDDKAKHQGIVVL